MASDDFRITIEFSDAEHATHLAEHLNERELAQELREALGDRLIVTRDGPHVYLYAGTEADAKIADQAVRKLVSEHGLKADVKPIERWHTIEKVWKPASEPLPETDSARAAEHERWEQREAADSLEDNLAEWEVRVELDSHEDAKKLAEQFEAEGIKPVVRRWKYLLVGAANEDAANQLADRIRSELPSGAELKVEPGVVWFYEGADRSPLSALFVMFGGLPRPGDQRHS